MNKARAALRTEYLNILKKVIKKNLSVNPDTLVRYKNELITGFNKYSTRIKFLSSQVKPHDQANIILEFNAIVNKTYQAFARLNWNCSLITEIGHIIKDDDLTKVNVNIEPEIQADNPAANLIDFENILNTTLFAMPMTKPEFLRLCASTINHEYDGDANKLQAFINAIKLLDEMAEEQPLKVTLVAFIRTKLTAKAIEAVPNELNTVQQIIDSLQNKIKPESSKVVEGRLAALKLDKHSLQEFAKMAEDLADQLKISLVMEGVSANKATEMVIDKTIRMCRGTAKSDLVKSVLASAKFESPKEVVSKFIVEVGSNSEEKQVLAYRTYNKKNNNRFNNDRYFNNRNNFDQNRGNNNNSKGGYRGKNNRAYNGQQNNNNNGQYRRNNYHNNNNNGSYRGGNNQNNGGNNNSQNNRNVRVVQGNSQGPAPNYQELECQQEM